MKLHDRSVQPRNLIRNGINAMQVNIKRPSPVHQSQVQVGHRGTQNQNKGGGSIANLIIVFSIPLVAIVVASIFYTRLHRIDLSATIDTDRPLMPRGFNFIANDAALGSVAEILYWAFLSTTQRWMRSGLLASKNSDFQIARHLVEWVADATATPVVATVVVYALRSLRLTSGQTVNLSLENASIGWFVVIGYLLGSVNQAPRKILNRMRKYAFGSPKENHKPKSEDDERKG
jgi:hypothetical protein